FYLGRPVAVAMATASELTSNYIAQYHEQYRTVPGSPLLPAGAWREALARCPLPTVFVATANNRDVRAALGAALPLLAADNHYAAYGPCRPHPLTPSPQGGEGGRHGEQHSPSPRRGQGAGGGGTCASFGAASLRHAPLRYPDCVGAIAATRADAGRSVEPAAGP